MIGGEYALSEYSSRHHSRTLPLHVVEPESIGEMASDRGRFRIAVVPGCVLPVAPVPASLREVRDVGEPSSGFRLAPVRRGIVPTRAAYSHCVSVGKVNPRSEAACIAFAWLTGTSPLDCGGRADGGTLTLDASRSSRESTSGARSGSLGQERVG